MWVCVWGVRVCVVQSRAPQYWLCCGGVLLSHTLPGAVPSALWGLASGFGMDAGRFPHAMTAARRFNLLSTPPAWHHCVVWGGCGLVVNPHSGCEQSPLFCLPTRPPVGGGGVLSSVGPLVPVGSQHLAVLPPLAYQPGSMPGASHPHKGGLETSSRSRLPA